MMQRIQFMSGMSISISNRTEEGKEKEVTGGRKGINQGEN
jgi:hypothetical protein